MDHVQPCPLEVPTAMLNTAVKLVQAEHVVAVVALAAGATVTMSRAPRGGQVRKLAARR